MPKDEVELGEESGDDYEMVPVGPIRKLERRIDEMEQKKTQGAGASDELVRDVLDIMKSNQKIVNDMTESTHELKNSVEDLTHKMDDVVDNMNSFMDLLRDASEADLEGEVIQDVHTRIADAVGTEMDSVAKDIKESNQQVVQHLENLNKSIKRSYTSQNKDQIMKGRNQSRGQSPSLNVNRDNNQGNNSRRQQGGQSQGQPNNQQQNPQGNQNQGRRSGGNGDRNDRMRKLRKKFDKQKNNE